MKNSIFKDWNILKWFANICIVFVTLFVLSSFVNKIFAFGYILMLVVHELGHIMAAMGYDVQVRFGGFTPFGAYIQILDQTSLKENAVIALSGPLCGLVTTIIYFLLFFVIKDVTFLWLSFFTGVVSLLNLLPLDPFDGGKVMQGTFCYLPFVFLPFLAYGAYVSYVNQESLWILFIMISIYIVFNVLRMHKRERMERMFYLKKSNKASIFFAYLLIVVLLAAILGAMYMDYGNQLLPDIKEVQLPDFLFQILQRFMG